ncbi:MAG: hypothetical protein FWF36_05555 [Propionibacteriaceae bacterium]|nr:hypothetical protein [Propionibacteriaceae bacterium]
MRLTAQCERSDGWWVARVPEVRGLFTQVRRLDQVEAWILDAASMLDEQPTEGYTVEVVPMLSNADRKAVEEANAGRAQLRQVEAKAAKASRTAIGRLKGEGLPVRDIATLLGISRRRVSAITA